MERTNYQCVTKEKGEDNSLLEEKREKATLAKSNLFGNNGTDWCITWNIPDNSYWTIANLQSFSIGNWNTLTLHPFPWILYTEVLLNIKTEMQESPS